MSQQTQWDVIIIGAGAAGLMCAAQAAYRGRQVLVLDNAKKPGRKILISGGGRCNFTNLYAGPQNFICRNPHFTKSALARYSQRDFIELVERHGVEYEEREHGQLFCTDSAKEIVRVLLTECEWAGVTLQLATEIVSVSRPAEGGFALQTSRGALSCHSLVVATGGLSMPKLGATPYGYRLAEQFGLKVVATHAGLVPFTLHLADKDVACHHRCFRSGQTEQSPEEPGHSSYHPLHDLQVVEQIDQHGKEDDLHQRL